MVQTQSAVARAWQEWREGGRQPDQSTELLAGGDRLSDDFLFEVVIADMWHRWNSRDQRPAAAEYFERFPQLQTSRGRELVACEFANTQLRDGHADPADFARRYPGIPLSTPDDLPSLPGHRDLHLLARLGGGRFGEVYFGVETLTRRPVAVKFPRDEVCDGEEPEQRFAKEIRIAASLSHEGIVKLLYADRSADGGLYFVMEYVSGPTLRQHMIETSLSFREIAGLVAQIADAIAYAHGETVIHRDLKPENILVTEHGEPRVTDFGLAKFHRDDETASTWMTQSGAALGTVGYMAPEQLESARRAGPPADVFSMGAILYELLTGQTPFAAEDQHAVLTRLTRFEGLRKPRELNPNVPAELDIICMRCLFRTPEKRLTAVDMRDELRAYAAGNSSSLVPIGLIERIRDRNPSGWRLGMIISTLVAVAILGGGAALATSAYLLNNANEVSDRDELLREWDSQLARLELTTTAEPADFDEADALLERVRPIEADDGDAAQQRYAETIRLIFENELLNRQRWDDSDWIFAERALESLRRLHPTAAISLSQRVEALRATPIPYFDLAQNQGTWKEDYDLSAFEIGESVRRRETEGPDAHGLLRLPSPDERRGVRLECTLDNWQATNDNWLVAHLRAQQLVPATTIAFPEVSDGSVSIGMADGRIVLAGMSSGNEWSHYRSSPSPVVAVSHARHRQVMAAAHSDGTVFLRASDRPWDHRDYDSELEHVSGVSVSPNGRYVAVWSDVASGHRLSLRDIDDDQQVALPAALSSGHVTSAVWIADDVLISAEQGGSLFRWQVGQDTDRVELNAVSDGVRALATTESEKVLALSGTGSVLILSGDRLEKRRTLPVSGIDCVTGGPDDSIICAQGNGFVLMIDHKGHVQSQWQLSHRRLTDIDAKADGRYILGLDQAGTVRMIDLQRDQVVDAPSRFLWQGYSVLLEFNGTTTTVSLLADGQLEHQRELSNVDSGAHIVASQVGRSVRVDVGSETRIEFDDILSGWRSGNEIALDLSPNVEVGAIVASTVTAREAPTALEDADAAYARKDSEAAISGYQNIVDNLALPESDRREAGLKLALCRDRKWERQSDAIRDFEVLTTHIEPDAVEGIASLYLLNHYTTGDETGKAQYLLERMKSRYTFEERATGNRMQIRSFGMQHLRSDLAYATMTLGKSGVETLIAFDRDLLQRRQLAAEMADYLELPVEVRLARKSDLLEVQWLDQSVPYAQSIAAATGEQSLKLLKGVQDPVSVARITGFGRVVERYCWLRRLEGRFSDALVEIQWARGAIKPLPFPPLLSLEEARILAALGKPAEASGILGDLRDSLLSDPAGDEYYGEYAQASEMLGFLTQQLASEQEAIEIWATGTHEVWQRTRSDNGHSSHQLRHEGPIAIGHHLALRLLAGELQEAQLKDVISAMDARMTPIMWVIPIDAAYLEITEKPEARELIEAIAFKRLSFSECFFRPVFFAAQSAAEAKSRALTKDELQLLNDTLDQAVATHFSKVGTAIGWDQVFQIAVAWEDLHKKGFQPLDQCPAFLQAPVAYFIGLRRAVENSDAAARAYFESSVTVGRAQNNLTVVALAENEIAKLDRKARTELPEL